MKKSSVLMLLILFSGAAMAQRLPSVKRLSENLKPHITYLASDELEGRLTGSEGEKLASEYIKALFVQHNLKAPFDGSYYQLFEFSKRPKRTINNTLAINGRALEIDRDYYPLSMSSSDLCEGEVAFVGYGIEAPDLNYNDFGPDDYSGKVLLMKIGSPDGNNPHGKYSKYSGIRDRINNAQNRGAAGVIFYPEEKDDPEPGVRLDRSVIAAGLPVSYITYKGLENANLNADYLFVEMNNEIVREKSNGKNVAGLIDNGAENYVVIGAHYDHLGFGEEGGSLWTGAESIHNGADDNASGTAALFELADYLSNGKFKKHNYLIAAFSGEELGLLGSSYLVSNLPIPKERVSYMINMDMIGRIEEDRSLGINGVGSSVVWKKIITKANRRTKFNIKTTESGIGSSDHTSFYLSDIPAIHFFSGTHSDYHRPSDDVEKLNLNGEADVIRLIIRMMKRLDKYPKLDFLKTDENDSKSSPRFTVTLGIMPAYFYEGPGLKVDGVSEGKPAKKAGMQKGDIIVRMDARSITDMMSYMDALGAYRKGDKAKVSVKRGEEVLILEVEF